MVATRAHRGPCVFIRARACQCALRLGSREHKGAPASCWPGAERSADWHLPFKNCRSVSTDSALHFNDSGFPRGFALHATASLAYLSQVTGVRVVFTENQDCHYAERRELIFAF